MIRHIKFNARGTQTVPTGNAPVRRAVAPAPRDTTRPVQGSPHSTFIAGEKLATGVHRNAPKPRPHILQGWRSPR